MSAKQTRLRNLFQVIKQKETDDKKTFKEILKDLADSSSLHGVPKIVASRQITVKVLWGLLFIATCSLLGYQLNGLFETYYSYPIQTTIQLDFNPITFPAISLCNMNPVRFSKLNISEDLNALFEKEVSGTTASPTMPPASSSQSTFYSTWSSTSSSLPSTSSTMSPASSSPSPSTFYSTWSSTSSSLPSTSSTMSPASSSPSSSTFNSTWSSSSSSIPSSTTDSLFSSTTGQYYDDYDDNYDYNYYSDYDYGDSYHDNWDNDVNEDNYIKQQLSGKTDEWAERAHQFRVLAKSLPLELRQKVGHQLDQFIMSAYFAGTEVNITRFKNFTSSRFGNCYTLSSKQFVAWRSGPANGIKITLNLETDEYINKFATGYGARLVLHEPGTYPLPFNEGITLSPGTETSVGLKMIRISRLGQPYGDCTSGDSFARKYRKKYSVAKTIDVCKCIPIDAPDQISFNKTVLPVCNTSYRADQECLLKVDVSFEHKSVCDCQGRCKETLYEKTISSRYWPTPEYSKHLMLKICKKLEQNKTVELPETCVSLLDSENYDYSLPAEEYEKHRKNFLRLLIYFEDLNFERITQEPMYEGIRFLSDIGGTMGLFLGASLLSLVEVLQLLLEIVLHIKKKLTRKKPVTPEMQPNPKQKSAWIRS